MSQPAISDIQVNENFPVLRQWSLSPIPAWAFSASLLLSPLLRPKAIPISANPNGTQPAPSSTFSNVLKSYRKFPTAYPSNVHVLVFASFVGLGGFMCFDNDPKNGSAVIGSWSLLYFMANVKKSVWNLKLYPKGLTAFALCNAAIYGGGYLKIF